MKYQEKELECIHCGKPFKINELFVCHIKDDGTITICTHLDCGKSQTKKEKNGGWGIIQRTLDGYILK